MMIVAIGFLDRALDIVGLITLVWLTFKFGMWIARKRNRSANS